VSTLTKEMLIRCNVIRKKKFELENERVHDLLRMSQHKKKNARNMRYSSVEDTQKSNHNQLKTY
jgi:hypothetical protein